MTFSVLVKYGAVFHEGLVDGLVLPDFGGEQEPPVVVDGVKQGLVGDRLAGIVLGQEDFDERILQR